MATQETMRRLAAIRRLARQMPLGTASERLNAIAEVASGKGDVEGVFKADVQNNLAERLEAGQASRSPVSAGHPDAPKPVEPDPKKRKLLGGRNRKETGGAMRNDGEGSA